MFLSKIREVAVDTDIPNEVFAREIRLNTKNEIICSAKSPACIFSEQRSAGSITITVEDWKAESLLTRRTLEGVRLKLIKGHVSSGIPIKELINDYSGVKSFNDGLYSEYTIIAN